MTLETILGGILAAAFAAVAILSRAAGKRKERDKQNRDRLKTMEDADEVANKVDGLSDDALRDLGRKWLR